MKACTTTSYRFNGGPGCSSFSGAFEELGPFYVNKDGKTLFENVYSWNAVAFLPTPTANTDV